MDARIRMKIMSIVFRAVIFTAKMTFAINTARGTAVMLRTMDKVINSRMSISSFLNIACVRK